MNEKTFVREHAVAFWTFYLLLVLFTNMYGFWRPFSVNVFGYAGILELVTNASLYAAQAFQCLVQLAIVGTFVVWFVVIILNFIRCGVFGSKRKFSVHAWLEKIQPESEHLRQLTVFLLLVGTCGILLPSPYEGWLFWLGFFAAIGFVVAAHVGVGLSGWSRAASMAAAVALSLLPFISYGRAAYAAEAIRNGCGTVRVMYGESETRSSLPVYLGQAGGFVFLYDDTLNQEMVREMHDFRLIHVDIAGRPAQSQSRTLAAWRSFYWADVPSCSAN